VVLEQAGAVVELVTLEDSLEKLVESIKDGHDD
jgi:Mg2+/Co2+ transporter CorC